MNQALEDGYVECSECGHLVEQHNLDGCYGVDGCTCPVRLSWIEIGQIRRDNGLPYRYNPRA